MFSGGINSIYPIFFNYRQLCFRINMKSHQTWGERTKSPWRCDAAASVHSPLASRLEQPRSSPCSAADSNISHSKELFHPINSATEQSRLSVSVGREEDFGKQTRRTSHSTWLTPLLLFLRPSYCFIFTVYLHHFSPRRASLLTRRFYQCYYYRFFNQHDCYRHHHNPSPGIKFHKTTGYSRDERAVSGTRRRPFQHDIRLSMIQN